MKKKLLIAGSIVGALALVTTLASVSVVTAENSPFGISVNLSENALFELIDRLQGEDVKTGLEPEPDLGAFPGTDIYADQLTFNGIPHYYDSQRFKAPTTTPCTFRSPNATTTLLYFAFDVDTSTSTASLFTIATSTLPNATTTSLATKPLASTEKDTYIHIPATEGAGLMQPQTYINLGADGDQEGEGVLFGGDCYVEWIAY